LILTFSLIVDNNPNEPNKSPVTWSQRLYRWQIWLIFVNSSQRPNNAEPIKLKIGFVFFLIILKS
jgi:hypothetical protein